MAEAAHKHILELKEVYKDFDGLEVLFGINLAVQEGSPAVSAPIPRPSRLVPPKWASSTSRAARTPKAPPSTRVTGRPGKKEKSREPSVMYAKIFGRCVPSPT